MAEEEAGAGEKSRLPKIFPIFRKRAPVLDLLRGQKVGITPETLTESQRRLAEDFKSGIASALGVPAEAIRQELVEKWVIGWTRAMVKPEYYASEARELGRRIVEIVRGGLRGEEVGPEAPSPPPRPAETTERRERYERGRDISLG
jgi:hypothetical protein